ncbi:DUF2971 domain-containing protein [Photobacterium kagoshimensis]|uniref:DUF2971 domain-containing protein n=1 Tax=Photobacterium kagoshimensis TaxID=2910242 RepID=UPI003D0EA260
MMLYKYRGISDLKFLVDIFLNNRLYAAKYTDMNDPMEGVYRYKSDYVTRDLIEEIRIEKRNIGICSLSEDSSNDLMWAHYAEGHKGVAIGVRIKGGNEIRNIKYEGLSKLTSTKYHDGYESALNILTHKLEAWDYEQEVRVFTRGEDFVDVEVCEVILGCKMDKNDKVFFKNLISKINPDIRIKSKRHHLSAQSM